MKDAESALRRHSRLLDIVRSHPGENSRVLAAIAMEILAVILESEGKPIGQDSLDLRASHPVEEKFVVDAVQLIWNHSHRISSVDSLVEQLPVTRRTLERRFRQAFGRTIGQEITRCRMERAKHFLVNTRLPIEHVALAVGFPNSAQLGKTFQRLEQTTPGAYRKRHGRT